MFSAANFTSTVEPTKVAHNIGEVSDYLINHDSNYSSKEIIADTSRFFEYELNTNVDSRDGADGKELDKSNATYVVSYKKLKIDNFDQIFKSGCYRLYERNSSI